MVIAEIPSLQTELWGAHPPDADLSSGHQYKQHVVHQWQIIILPVLPFITNYTGDRAVVVI